MKIIRVLSIAIGAAAVLTSSSVAAELTVISAGPMRPVISAIATEFERTTGNKIVAKYVSGPTVKTEIENGASFDIAISLGPVIDELIKTGKLQGDSRQNVATAGLGVLVRAGSVVPDISSPESLKKTLLHADSIAYSSAGVGAYFLRMLSEYQIAEDLKAKLKPMPSGGTVKAVAAGEASLGVSVVPEIVSEPAVTLVGPIGAPDLLLLSAAVTSHSTRTEAARTFVSFLRSPAAASSLKTNGMTPAAAP